MSLTTPSPTLIDICNYSFLLVESFQSLNVEEDMAMTRAAKIALTGIFVILLVALFWPNLGMRPTSPSSSISPSRSSSSAQPIYHGPDGKEVAASVAAKQRGKGDAASKLARQQPRWFEGGTLRHKTVRAWRKASHRNRLATSAGFVATLATSNGPTSFSMSDLKKVAPLLEVCISAIAEPKTPKIPGRSDMEVAEVAAICIQSLTALFSN